MRRTLYLLLGLAFAILFTYNGCKHEPDVIIDPDPDPDTTSCDTSNVTYPGTVYPILNQYCISCHSGANPTGNLDFTDYNRVAFVAESGALLGAIKHMEGYSAMPQPPGSPKLDSCRIRQFEIWINDTTFYPPPDTTHPCDPDTIYFEMDVLPVLISSCAKSRCHDTIGQEDVRLYSYAAVMASDVVTPGDPNNSDMYEKITEDDPDKIMPPPGETPLDAEQIEIIRKWIAQGAQNLYCDEMCDTNNFTFSGVIWPEIIHRYCFGCHNGANASGGIHLENHAQVAAAVVIPAGMPGSLWGAVNYASGNKGMPKNQSKLSDCRITQIRKWKDAGALDN